MKKKVQDREPYAVGYRLEVNDDIAKVALPRGPAKTIGMIAFMLLFTWGPLALMLLFSFGNTGVFWPFLLLGIPAGLGVDAIFVYFWHRERNRPSPWTIDRKQGRVTLAGPPEETLAADAIRAIRIEREVYEYSDSRKSVYTVYADLKEEPSAGGARVLGVFEWERDALRLGEQTAEMVDAEYLPEGAPQREDEVAAMPAPDAERPLRAMCNYQLHVDGDVARVEPQFGRWHGIGVAVLAVQWIMIPVSYFGPFPGGGSTFLTFDVISATVLTFLAFRWYRREFVRPSPWQIDIQRGRLTITGPPQEEIALDDVREIKVETVRHKSRFVYPVHAVCGNGSESGRKHTLAAFDSRHVAFDLAGKTAKIVGVPLAE